jgi:transcriptional/translational regulatory protein YebC/TACO1
MANHGKTEKTAKQKRARAEKPSRAKRIARRWDARVETMRADLAARLAARIEAATHPERPLDEIDRAILNIQAA